MMLVACQHPADMLIVMCKYFCCSVWNVIHYIIWRKKQTEWAKLLCLSEASAIIIAEYFNQRSENRLAIGNEFLGEMRANDHTKTGRETWIIFAGAWKFRSNRCHQPFWGMLLHIFIHWVHYANLESVPESRTKLLFAFGI